MPIAYSCVGRDQTILCEFAPQQGNFQKVAVEVLAKSPKHNSRFTYNADKHTFNVVVHNGYIFLAVADDEYGRQIPFAYLDKLKEEFVKAHGETAKTATANSLQRVYGAELKRQAEHAMAHPEDVNKVAKVQAQVAEVKEVMMHNIEKVLERGEKIDTLVDKTENLRFQADQFQKSGRSLRNKMWWQNVKMKLMVFMVVAIIIVIIFCFACFSGGKDCTKKKKLLLLL